MIHNHLSEALAIIDALGLPRAQQNERSALCLLALLNLTPDKSWAETSSPLVGITPIMKFAAVQYGHQYAPNTRETFRRQTMHQFVETGLALYNPDAPERPVNSPKAVYQIEPDALALMRTFGTDEWSGRLPAYLAVRQTLAAKYAQERNLKKIPVRIAEGKEIQLSPGAHSLLIKAIIEEFAPRFVPGSVLIYAGDTAEKVGYFDEALLVTLGVRIDKHGKMPDVILYDSGRDWLILVESVTSHGPVDGKRHSELAKLFRRATPGIVYVTAFPSRPVMGRYVADISWETEVWVADSPSHLIHFNGVRFLGPYSSSNP